MSNELSGGAAGQKPEQLAQSARVLVVDDEPYNVELLLFELEDRGFTVFTASDGQHALELLEKQEVDLALVDVMMPRLNGIDFTRRIRESKAWKELPVILLTAKGTLDDKREGFEAGANDYVVKPFDIENVLVRIDVQLRIVAYQQRRQEWAEASSRVAMVGAAAHELAQPLAGASGYLQLLSNMRETSRLDEDQTRVRLHQVHDCLIKTGELAGKIQRMVRVVLEDYACGMKIVDIHESARLPEALPRNPEEVRATVVRVQAGSQRDSNLPRELENHQITLLDLPPGELPAAQQPDLILLSVPDRSSVVRGLLEQIRTAWDSNATPLPPLLALLPADLMGSRAPGVDLLKLGISDVLSRPFQMEELILRMRSLIRLHRFRLQDLHSRSLAAAQEVRQRTLQGFMPILEGLQETIRPLLLNPSDFPAREESLFKGLDQLTLVVRRLQSRELTGPGQEPADS